MCITIFSLGHGFCPMALATGCKPNPFHYNHVFRLTLIRVYYNPDLI